MARGVSVAGVTRRHREKSAVPVSPDCAIIARDWGRVSFGMWSGRPRKVHPSQVAQRRNDGTVEVRLEVALGPPLLAYLTGLGAAVSEIEPSELRAAVLREHRRAVAGLAGRVSRRVAGGVYGALPTANCRGCFLENSVVSIEISR
jgi:WYL domain-containing protein